MARRRFEQLPDERKAEIMAVAARHFSEHGFHNASYNQLLQEAGLGKSSAYYYFADKQDLFLTVVKECYRVFFEGSVDLPVPKSQEAYWEQIEQLNLRGLDFMVEDPTSAAIIACFAKERDRLDALSAAEVLASFGDFYERLIRQGQRLGAVRRDLPLELLLGTTQALLSACDRWFIEHPNAARKGERRRTAQRFTELVRRLLVAP